MKLYHSFLFPLFLLFWSGCASSSANNYPYPLLELEQIKVGMTSSDVLAKIGRPSDQSISAIANYAGETWTYTNSKLWSNVVQLHGGSAFEGGFAMGMENLRRGDDYFGDKLAAELSFKNNVLVKINKRDW